MIPYKQLEIITGDDDADLIQKSDELVKKQPIIPDKIHDSMPDLIKKINITELNKGNARKKDLILLSTLSCLSSMFPSVSGIYFDDYAYCNLYFFVIGRASSGKSVMKVGLKILKEYERKLKAANELKYREYEFALESWEAQKDKKSFTKPELPKIQNLNMTCNISQAKFIDEIGQGTCLMFETEANKMATNFKQDWGNYSSELRSIYHHEQITKERVGTKKVEINEPKLSVCISGTVDQAFNVLGKSQDGLFSRFMIYNYSADSEFTNPFSKESMGEILKNRGITKEVLEMIEFYENRDIKFKLTEEQEKYFTQKGTEILTKMKIGDNRAGEVDGLVYRHLGISWKLCMLLTIIRNSGKFELSFSHTLIPTDEDLKTAITLASILIRHSSLVFYSQEEKIVTFKENKQEKIVNIINNIKGDILRQDLLKIGNKQNINERTIDRALASMTTNGILDKKSAGIWVKK